MIHSAGTQVCLVDLKGDDVRTDNMCENNDYYQLGLWINLGPVSWINQNFDLS